MRINQRGRHSAPTPNADAASMIVGAVLVLTGGVVIVGTDAALDMLDAQRSTSEWTGDGFNPDAWLDTEQVDVR